MQEIIKATLKFIIKVKHLYLMQNKKGAIQIVASLNSEIFTLFNTGFDLSTEIPLGDRGKSDNLNCAQ